MQISKAKKALYFFLVFVLILVLYGTIPLAIKEYLQSDICPKIVGIPACYIVLVCFLAGFISHLFHRNNVFFVAIGIVGLIASYGSIGNLIGFAECPKTEGGIPMCYISLSLCCTLLIGKFLQVKK